MDTDKVPSSAHPSVVVWEETGKRSALRTQTLRNCAKTGS